MYPERGEVKISLIADQADDNTTNQVVTAATEKRKPTSSHHNKNNKNIKPNIPYHSNSKAAKPSRKQNTITIEKGKK